MGVAHYTTAQLASLAPAWDRAVARTPGADPFCASSVWSFSAAASFRAAGPATIVGDGTAFCGLRPTATPDGTPALVGLDPIWGFATPCVGPPERAAAMLARRVALMPDALVAISGQRDDSPATAQIIRALPGHTLYRGPTESRLRADLSDGTDAWFARRSARFRQRLRRIRRDAARTSIIIDDRSADDPDELFDRLLAIERASWKGGEGTGMASAELAAFYRTMARALAARGGLRAKVARQGGHDVGYILGGVLDTTYRGLQISYVTEVAAASVGHLLQVATIDDVAGEGTRVYDLGMDIDYKRRWADERHDTISILAVPRGRASPI